MPYRRLPNTDQARLRALKAALSHYWTKDLSDLLFSYKTALEVDSVAPMFEQAVMQYVNGRNLQAELSRSVAESGRIARLYLSHFIQVFNMCIARGEINAEARAMLSLEECGNLLPDLSTELLLIEWGRKIVEGEERRMFLGGGNRIYNPSIALVKVKLQCFEENYFRHRDILNTIQQFHAKLEEERLHADKVILNVWNEVEERLSPIDTDVKREICQKYGIVYFYRPQERQKEFIEDGQIA